MGAGKIKWFLIRDRATYNQRQSMDSETSANKSLRDLELEVEAEGREWMRGRLEQKLQGQVEQQGAIFPPQRAKSAPSKAATDAVAHGLGRGRLKGMAGEESG
jgi:hypothetical protein